MGLAKFPHSSCARYVISGGSGYPTILRARLALLAILRLCTDLCLCDVYVIARLNSRLVAIRQLVGGGCSGLKCVRTNVKLKGMNSTPTISDRNSNEHGIDCEIAADIIAECFAFFAKLLAEEKNAPSPSCARVEALETQLRALRREKMAVAVENSALITKALYIVSVRRLVISPDFRNFLTFKRMPNVVADLSAAADRKD